MVRDIRVVRGISMYVYVMCISKGDVGAVISRVLEMKIDGIGRGEISMKGTVE